MIYNISIKKLNFTDKVEYVFSNAIQELFDEEFFQHQIFHGVILGL
jgi:hypothetical protein